MLWRCWLGGRKGMPVKNMEWWGDGMVICLEQGAHDLLMPLPPRHLLLQQNSEWLILLVSAYPCWPRKKRPLNGCVWVCVCIHTPKRHKYTQIAHTKVHTKLIKLFKTLKNVCRMLETTDFTTILIAESTKCLHICRSTCISLHSQLKTKGQLCPKFYCLHALAEGN